MAAWLTIALSLSLSRRYYYVYRSKRWNRVGSVPYPKREHASSDVGLHAREIHHARYTLSLISTCARSHFLLRHDSRYQTPRSISRLISASRLRGRNIARVVPGKLETDLFQNFARFEEIRKRERETYLVKNYSIVTILSICFKLIYYNCVDSILFLSHGEFREYSLYFQIDVKLSK